MTCELAGSYDLLVPLMLAEGIAFVALRNRSLYHAQVATKRDSPAHRDDLIFDVLTGIRVGDVLVRDRPVRDADDADAGGRGRPEGGGQRVARRLPGPRRERQARGNRPQPTSSARWPRTRTSAGSRSRTT